MWSGIISDIVIETKPLSENRAQISSRNKLLGKLDGTNCGVWPNTMRMMATSMQQFENMSYTTTNQHKEARQG